jgi:hypothetical protein
MPYLGILLECFNEWTGGKMPALIRHHLVRLHYYLAASQYNHSINILSTGFPSPYLQGIFRIDFIAGISDGRQLTRNRHPCNSVVRLS